MLSIVKQFVPSTSIYIPSKQATDKDESTLRNDDELTPGYFILAHRVAAQAWDSRPVSRGLTAVEAASERCFVMAAEVV